MKIYYCAQGSDEWNDLHLGIPTASQFHRIVQPGGEVRYKKNGEPYKTQAGELAKGRWTYAYELVAERLLRETKHSTTGLYWPERGKLLEADAIRHYEFVHSCRTAKVGFITPDHGLWGCSPDFLIVDEMGGGELKCPSAEKHIEYFYEGPGTDYKCQYSGSMMITGFPTWEFMSFHPQLPDALYTFKRDDEFIDKLHKGLVQFCEEVDRVEKKVRDAGFISTVQQYDEGYGEMMRSDMNAAGAIMDKQNWGG